MELAHYLLQITTRRTSIYLLKDSHFLQWFLLLFKVGRIAALENWKFPARNYDSGENYFAQFLCPIKHADWPESHWNSPEYKTQFHRKFAKTKRLYRPHPSTTTPADLINSYIQTFLFVLWCEYEIILIMPEKTFFPSHSSAIK